MRLLSALISGLLLLVLIAVDGRTQGNSCEENIDPGNSGCGIFPIAVIHASGLGGIQMGGTEYDDTCATGAGGCTVNQPMMRFWEQDRFDSRNSGSHFQSHAGVEWMVNPLNDFSFGADPGIWIFKSANWANTGVQGCPSDGRVVGEVSFCDRGAAPAYYVIGSTAGPMFYDFDQIDDGSGGSIMQLTQVPVPVAQPSGDVSVLPGYCIVQFDLDAPLQWYTESGPGDPANELAAGYEVLYQLATDEPASACQSGLGAWTPVLDPEDGGSNLGVVAPGSGLTAAVPMPPGNEQVYLSARVVYADAETGCVPGDCPAPQTQGAPASCFAGHSGPVLCEDTTNVINVPTVDRPFAVMR